MIMNQEERWQKRYNEDEGPEKQTANGYGDSGFGREVNPKVWTD